MTVRYSRTALKQLSEILSFLADRDTSVATATANRIASVAAMLARRPSMGRPTDLSDVRVFRAAPYPYLIFYRQRGAGEITILRIRHRARAPHWRSGS